MDDDLAQVAQLQHGTFTVAQSRSVGITKSGAQHRRAKGAWSTAAAGVLSVPGAPRTWEQHVVVMALAAGPGAAASHRTAAALLRIPGFARSGPVEVTTLRTRRHRSPAGTVHQTRILPVDHLTTIEGICTTRVARTLIDLAGTEHPRRVERAVDGCLAAQTVSVAGLRTVTDLLARRGRKGIRLMRLLLGERGDGYVAPASELEARFRRMLRSAGLQQPIAELNVGDDRAWAGRVDVTYPHIGLIVELDSRRHHTAKLDWESDRLRDNRLVAGGWRVIRLTWDQVVNHPDEVLALLLRSGVTLERPSSPK